MTNNTKIRFAKPEDIEQIVALCALHAKYEKAEYTKSNKAKRLSKDLFANNPKLYCLVVEKNNELIAYATYMTQYATWDATAYIYMDCLYVKELFRSQGIGEQLILKIKDQGLKLGCTLIQWQTPSFNTRAIKFYKRLGATFKNKERFFLNIKKPKD